MLGIFSDPAQPQENLQEGATSSAKVDDEYPCPPHRPYHLCCADRGKLIAKAVFYSVTREIYDTMIDCEPGT